MMKSVLAAFFYVGLTLIIGGCGSAAESAAAPSNGQSSTEDAVWVPLEASLPPTFFQNNKVVNDNAESGIYLPASVIDDLISRAIQGNGYAQQALFAVSMKQIDADGHLQKKIDSVACKQAEAKHPVAAWHCAFALLRFGKDEREFQRATEIIWPMLGVQDLMRVPFPVDVDECGRSGSTTCYWNAFKTRDVNADWMMSLRNAAYLSHSIEMCGRPEHNLDAETLEACGVFFDSSAPDTSMSKYWERAKVRAALSPWHGHRGPTRRRARRLIDALQSLDPDAFKYFDRKYRCGFTPGEKPFECGLGEANGTDIYVQAAYVTDLASDSCRRKQDWWEAVQNDGLPVNIHSLDVSGLAECALSGNGVPQNFNLAERIGYANLVAAGTHGGSNVLAWRFGAKGYGGANPELAYFVLSVLGDDLNPRSYFVSDDAPHVQRTALAAAIPPDRLMLLQERASRWQSVKIKMEQERALLGALTFFGHLRPTFVPGGEQSIASSKTQGTGFVVSDQGHVVTNAHVVGHCKQLTSTTPELNLRVIAVDLANDLALLHGDSITKKPLPIRASQLGLGEEVSALGYPLSSFSGGQFTATSGTVTAMSGPQGDSRLFQLSAPVHPGNSGGPVVDKNGSVVGVIVATADAKAVLAQSGTLPQNMNYAIKASTLASFLDSNGVKAASTRWFAWPRDAIGTARPSVLSVSCGGA